MKKPLGLLLSALLMYPTLIPAQTQPPARDSMYTFTDSTLAFRVMVPVKDVFKSPLKNTPGGQAISQYPWIPASGWVNILSLSYPAS